MKIKYIIILSILLISSCKQDLLDVEYKNSPSFDAVMGEPDDVKGLASSLFYNWHKAQYHAYTYSPIMAMWTMADQGTASWGNGGMLDLSSEPRQAFINTEDYTYSKITKTYYERLYANINTANDILRVIKDGMEIGDLDEDGKGDETQMVKAFCYFNQGISLGYLALVFDRAFVVTDVTDFGNKLELLPYNQVADSAVVQLQKCIDICENNGFTIDASWINGSEYSNNELAQLSHSFIARILIGNPRNITDNDNADWAKISEHAQKGITRDLAPFMDNTTWKQYFFNYTFNNQTLDWCGIDSRIIHMMDPNYPEVYPDLSTEPKPAHAVSDDHRLVTDFRYDSSCPLKADRGYYHFFDYEYKRYDYNTYNNPQNVVDFSVTENDLIIAEAKYMLGDIAGAKSIINSGTRITRGQLEEVTDDSKVLDAIFYERDIELLMTGFGTSFFDMRRRDMLQKGTPLHFPIPAKELNVMSIPLYSFGGEANADGINTSNGGWKTKK